MPYKCEYGGTRGCENCKHYHIYTKTTAICDACQRISACPIVSIGGHGDCSNCLFEPKEPEKMRGYTAEEAKAHSRVLKNLSIDTGVNVLELIGNQKESEETNMIMTEEIDEQLALYKAEEAKTAIDAGITLNGGITVTATTLKNCSCGGTPIMVCKASIPPYYVIKCPKCGKKTDLCGTHADAEKVWNAIATENITETEKVEPLKPCRCGVMPHLEYAKSMTPKYCYKCPSCGIASEYYETPMEAHAGWNREEYQGLNRKITGVDVREVSLVENPANPNCAIKDSGERREFETGAVRDMSEGKGLMVVMPAAALLRLSRHYEHGAKKYGKFNWQKGIPVSSFMDSALRHIMKYLDGWDDEDHLAAAAFNILGAMEMEAHKPAMQDIPAREGAKSFNYSQGE